MRYLPEVIADPKASRNPVERAEPCVDWLAGLKVGPHRRDRAVTLLGRERRAIRSPQRIQCFESAQFTAQLVATAVQILQVRWVQPDGRHASAKEVTEEQNREGDRDGTPTGRTAQPLDQRGDRHIRLVASGFDRGCSDIRLL